MLVSAELQQNLLENVQGTEFSTFLPVQTAFVEWLWTRSVDLISLGYTTVLLSP